jgi:hypothetical protein
VDGEDEAAAAAAAGCRADGHSRGAGWSVWSAAMRVGGNRQQDVTDPGCVTLRGTLEGAS